MDTNIVDELKCAFDMLMESMRDPKSIEDIFEHADETSRWMNKLEELDLDELREEERTKAREDMWDEIPDWTPLMDSVKRACEICDRDHVVGGYANGTCETVRCGFYEVVKEARDLWTKLERDREEVKMKAKFKVDKECKGSRRYACEDKDFPLQSVYVKRPWSEKKLELTIEIKRLDRFPC